MNKFISTIKKIFAPIDLTKGKPYKVIILFALPILLSNLINQVYHLADAIVVGQTIPQQFAGINDTNPLSFLIIQFAGGTTIGLSVAIANRFSKKDYASLRKSIAQCIIICFLITIILTILGLSFINPLLNSVGLNENVDPVSFTAGKIYMITIIAGLFGCISYNLIINICRSIGDSVTPLIFLVISNILNIVLDIIFALTFKGADLKVFGVAFATVISWIISSILCFIYTFKKYKFIRLTKEDFHFSSKDFLYHIKISIPLGLQYSILAIGIVIMQNGIVQFDVNNFTDGNTVYHYVQDGYGAACKLQNFLNTAYFALASSILAYVAQNDGIKNLERLNKGIKQGFIIGLILYAIITISGLLFTINGAFVHLFLKGDHITKETIKYGSIYLYVSLPLGIVLFSLIYARNCLQGFSKPLFPFLAGVGELVARILAVLFFPTLLNPSNPYSEISFAGLSFADGFAWIIGGLILVVPLLVYLKKKNKDPSYKSIENNNIDNNINNN